MKKLFKKFTLFTSIFAVAWLTLSTAVVAKDVDKLFQPVTRTIAKTNHKSLRTTEKMTQQRLPGSFQTRIIRQANTQSSTASQPQIRLRENSIQSSINAFGFEIYDVSVYLIRDLDNDGYYSDIDVEMDVDVESGFANVYAEIYFLNDNSEWQWLATTNSFEIEGNLASDSHTVAIRLVDDMPADSYDLLIDVFEVGFAGVVATLEAFEDADLQFLPLEDSFRDSGSNSLILEGISMNLFADDDFDGFYHGFDLEVTVDNETFPRNLQAVLYSRDSVSGWYLETSTNPGWINYGETVSFVINGIWGFDRPTDYYDFLVELVDADTGEIVDSFGPEFLALSEKPMESSNLDFANNEVVVVVDGGVSGGSINSLLLLLLILMGFARGSYLKQQSEQLRLQ